MSRRCFLSSHAARGGASLVAYIHFVDGEHITDLETFLTAPENIRNVFSYAFTSVPNLPDPDSDPDSPATYGGVSNAGYLGGVGGGPEGAESALTTNVGTLAGLGFGYVPSRWLSLALALSVADLLLHRLPLSRIYAGYFGGSLDLVSMYGWGTDVYCVIKTV